MWEAHSVRRFFVIPVSQHGIAARSAPPTFCPKSNLVYSIDNQPHNHCDSDYVYEYLEIPLASIRILPSGFCHQGFAVRYFPHLKSGFPR
jgi:hypothetical protein